MQGKSSSFFDKSDDCDEGEVCTVTAQETLDGPTTIRFAKKIIKKAGGSIDFSDLIKKLLRKMFLDDEDLQIKQECEVEVKSHLKDSANFSFREGKSKALIVKLKEAHDINLY